MAEAYREAEKRPSSMRDLDSAEKFEWVCARAGITVEEGLRLRKLQRVWPEGARPEPPKDEPPKPCSVCSETGLVDGNLCPNWCAKSMEEFAREKQHNELAAEKTA